MVVNFVAIYDIHHNMRNTLYTAYSCLCYWALRSGQFVP